MTSISSTQYSHFSPRAMMDSKISQAVSAGTISTDDQTAFSTALDSIDSSLEAARTSGTKPSGDIKSKVDSLIDEQVKSGKLTDDQADELKTLFAQGPGSTDKASGTGGVEGMGGPRGPGGPGGPPPCGGASSGDDEDEDDDETTTEDATAQLDALMAFLEKLRETLSSGVYGESGSTASSGSGNSGLVVNATA